MKLAHFFLLLFNFIYFSETLKFCPEKCKCVKNKVGCLHAEMLTVPDAPDDAISLDLRFNRIYDLQPGGFSSMHYLRSLLLNDNNLRTLQSGVFSGLRRLKYLYLYRNRIFSISPDVFKDLKHLEQLYLHINEIHTIEADLFANMPRLERLYLHNNRLTSIPVGSFSDMPRLRKLRLDSNALVCDCSMLWMVRMLGQHSEMQVAATCYEPAHITGTALASMSETDFKCHHPEFEIEPQDVDVNYGEDAMFTCIAIGEPTPEIVWFHDSVAIPNDTTRYEILKNGSLMLHDVDESDMGVFECMAKNPSGKVHSKPATMTINDPKEKGIPEFTTLPETQTVKIGQTNVKFDCVAKAKPKPHITWFFNGERILLSDHIFLLQNGSLAIYKVEDADAGPYMCQAQNVLGKITMTVELKISAKPYFDSFPKSLTIPNGKNAEFFCSARGVPTPTLSWFRDTVLIKTGNNIELSEDHRKLTIFDVSDEDDGLYHCRAENTEGYLDRTAILEVLPIETDPPRIISKPEDTDAYKETSVLIPCEIEAKLPAVIEWRKDGARIIVDEKFRITVTGGLIIDNVTVTDSGRYECSVFNENGRDSASAFLTIKDSTLPGDAYINIALTQATRDIDKAIANTVDKLFRNQNAKRDINDLYRIISFPNAPQIEIARSAEIYERTLDKVKEYINDGLNITSAEPFDYQHILSNQQVEVIGKLSGCVGHRESHDCEDMCYHTKYRSYDGTCNNFANPTWGSSLSGFRRILFPIYENGFSQPVGWNKGRKYNGYTLPSARLVSNKVITTTAISQDSRITHMVMQWGQWLDHDVDHSLPSVSSITWDGVDCKKTCEFAAPCFPIKVPENDARITNRRCIDFIRTSAVCGSGMTSVLFGALQPREQINQLTSFIDASQVYGFEKAVAEDLRDLTNENGLLRVGATYPGRKPLLPTTGINGMDCRRNMNESTRNCFMAGDIRANEQVGLAAFHTIWMREHNRVALKLKTINPFWDGERVYQEARKVVGAEIQFITYKHWLPIIIGPEGIQLLGEYKEYNPNLNPSVSNVFATAALRFGHSLINPIMHRYDENFETIPEGHLQLRYAFFSPWRLVDEGGVDPLIRGMFYTPAKLKTPTQNLNSELTEKLFYSTHAVALDLAAINIQRSRDHGIPFYTKFREFCNMSEVNSFDDLAGEISDKSVRDKLKELYGSVYNIDVWVGGILEDQVEGGKVGPLFRCLLIEQFERLRDGDRFWYESSGVFKTEQLRQIKETNLARILCDNSDSIDTIGENVFLLPELQDGFISCDALPSIDFRYWADCESCGEYSGGREKRRARRDLAKDGIEKNETIEKENEKTYQVENKDEIEMINATEKLDVIEMEITEEGVIQNENEIDKADGIIDEHERLSIIESAQHGLAETVYMLKKRIEYLEENCKMDDVETLVFE